MVAIKEPGTLSRQGSKQKQTKQKQTKHKLNASESAELKKALKVVQHDGVRVVHSEV